LKPVPVRPWTGTFFHKLDMRRQTIRRASTVLHLALVWSAAVPAPSERRSFSADIVSQDDVGAALAPAARFHAANHKARIEMFGATDGFFLSDSDAGSAWFVRPAQRLYMDAGRSTPLTRIFLSIDARDPCRQWKAAAARAGVARTDEWRCEFVRTDILNAHEIFEYRVLTPDQRSSYGWIDSKLGFPVKWQTADGKIFALKNIEFHAQPATLFDIPSDYRKLDPQALLERIKHSDVWAEPAK
jgi:hypothetical protein